MSSYTINKNDDPDAIEGTVEIVFTANNAGQTAFLARVHLTSGANPLKCLLLAFEKQGVKTVRKGGHPALVFTDEHQNHYLWGIMETPVVG